MSPRRDEALKLRANGLRYSEIARRMGISRQCAWMLAQPDEKYRAITTHPRKDRSLLSTYQVAGILHLHVTTIRRWCNEGKMGCIRLGRRGIRRFRREDIESFLRICSPQTFVRA